MQGIVLKRLGHDVVVLEQYFSSKREGQAAGIVAMQHAQIFMKSHDLLQEQPYAVSCAGVQVLDSNAKVLSGHSAPLKMTSWNVLYYRLRANFDGLESVYCPETPKEPPGNGEATYQQGKKVTDLRYQEGSVFVDFEDTESSNSAAETLQPDMVIVADGSTSSIRRMLEPNLRRQYAGYVIWRGTVLESDVSQETRETFQLKTTLHTTKDGYLALSVVHLQC